MKRLLTSALLLVALCSCATLYNEPESVRATEAMTDMDGRPIYPGWGWGSGVSVGVGIGSWGHRGGGGVGIGIGSGW
jgi:hypothetical protein